MWKFQPLPNRFAFGTSLGIKKNTKNYAKFTKECTDVEMYQCTNSYKHDEEIGVLNFLFYYYI